MKNFCAILCCIGIMAFLLFQIFFQSFLIDLFIKLTNGTIIEAILNNLSTFCMCFSIILFAIVIIWGIVERAINKKKELEP